MDPKNLSTHTAAACTYYKTKSQEKSLKESGKFEERSRVRRRRERLLRVSALVHEGTDAHICMDNTQLCISGSWYSFGGMCIYLLHIIHGVLVLLTQLVDIKCKCTLIRICDQPPLTANTQISCDSCIILFIYFFIEIARAFIYSSKIRHASQNQREMEQGASGRGYVQ